MATEEPPVSSALLQSVYGPVQVRTISCSREEAEERYSVWNRPQFIHTGVVRIYEWYPPELTQEGWRTGYLAEAVGLNLQNELEERRNMKKGWQEEEILWVLRCVVDVMSQAEEQGWAHCRISLSTIYSSQHRVLLAPFFRTSFYYSGQLRYAYLSPELKIASFTGSVEQCDLIKADIYALGMVLLSMAAMTVPKEGAITHTIENLSGFPRLRPYLRRFLVDKPGARPSFMTLESEFRSMEQVFQQSSGQDLQASLHPRKIAPVCATCSGKVQSWQCPALSSALQPYAAFKADCCSMRCFEQLCVVALQDSVRAKGGKIAKVVTDMVWRFAVPAVFRRFCFGFPMLAPVAFAAAACIGINL